MCKAAIELLRHGFRRCETLRMRLVGYALIDGLIDVIRNRRYHGVPRLTAKKCRAVLGVDKRQIYTLGRGGSMPTQLHPWMTQADEGQPHGLVSMRFTAMTTHAGQRASTPASCRATSAGWPSSCGPRRAGMTAGRSPRTTSSSTGPTEPGHASSARSSA